MTTGALSWTVSPAFTPHHITPQTLYEVAQAHLGGDALPIDTGHYRIPNGHVLVDEFGEVTWTYRGTLTPDIVATTLEHALSLYKDLQQVLPGKPSPTFLVSILKDSGESKLTSVLNDRLEFHRYSESEFAVTYQLQSSAT